MQKPAAVQLENNPHNNAGVIVVLYFEKAPTREEVVEALKSPELPNGKFEPTPQFSFTERPNRLSEIHKLHRIECYE